VGRLAILWNPETIILENSFTTKWTISANYRSIRSNTIGFITNVYALPKPTEKSLFLDNLESLGDLIQNHL